MQGSTQFVNFVNELYTGGEGASESNPQGADPTSAMDRRPIGFRILEAWRSGRITRIEMLELLAMIREDLEARDEARDALDAAEEELAWAFSIVEDTLLDARNVATWLGLCTDEDESEWPFEGLGDLFV